MEQLRIMIRHLIAWLTISEVAHLDTSSPSPEEITDSVGRASGRCTPQPRDAVSVFPMLLLPFVDDGIWFLRVFYFLQIPVSS
jgi:hypothetical protein